KDLAQLLELGILAVVGEIARLSQKALHLGTLFAQVLNGQRDKATQNAFLELLVLLLGRRFVDVLIGSSLLEEIGRIRDAPLTPFQLLDAAGAYQFDGLVQTFQSALE